MAWTVEEQVQRGHNFAIIDEVDSILIDEARTPDHFRPAAGEANRWYAEFARIAATLLKRGEDYEVDEKKRTVSILEPGIDKVEDHLGVKNLYESKNTPLIGFLNNSIKAKELFTNNKDYVVIDGEVLIVDEHTGRILPGRRYNDGIHQAIEAKEGVEIKPENQTMATGDPAELLPHVRQAVRYDRYRGNRSGRVHEHLRARRGAHPHQQGCAAHRQPR